MLVCDRLFGDLREQGINLHREALEPLIRGRLSDTAHGKMGEWREIIAMLPDVDAIQVTLDCDAISAATTRIPTKTLTLLRELLLGLAPWRKGPFDLFGINVDTEWRSQIKWARVSRAITPLEDRRVLDVGCGNGYYAFRMRGLGAKLVLGIDPSLNCLAQFVALQKYLNQDSVHVLPLRLQELPQLEGVFDTTFSMGVLYHQREPLIHLAQLRDTLRRGGELVLETLVMPGDEAGRLVPGSRYARMSNVWVLPTISELQHWLAQSGFDRCQLANVSVTSCDEQRSTEWMPFESLDKAIDPENEALTIEGLPRPTRAIIIGARS